MGLLKLQAQYAAIWTHATKPSTGKTPPAPEAAFDPFFAACTT
jgi:hypothetical protein